MPGFATHYCFGLRAYKELRKGELKSLLHQHHRVYSLGLQGPDFFMYFLPTAAGLLPKYSEMIHTEKTNAFLVSLAKAATGLSNRYEYEVGVSYFLGFLGHYYLDAKVHPYVYSRVGTEQTTLTTGQHFGCESDIDREVLYHEKGIRPEAFNHALAVNVSQTEIGIIAGILSQAIRETYASDLSPLFLVTILTGYIPKNGFLMDPYRIKTESVSFIEQHTLGHEFFSPLFVNGKTHIEDPCNTAHKAWTNPWAPEKTSSASVYDLMDEALPEYVTAMDKLRTVLSDSYHGLKVSLEESFSIIGSLSYITGLPV